MPSVKENEVGVYLEQAIGSSQDPGTDCTTIFDSLIPEARSLAFAPARRGSIIAAAGQYDGGGGCSGGLS